jgi:hypothetical protein
MAHTSTFPLRYTTQLNTPLSTHELQLAVANTRALYDAALERCERVWDTWRLADEPDDLRLLRVIGDEADAQKHEVWVAMNAAEAALLAVLS